MNVLYNIIYSIVLLCCRGASVLHKGLGNMFAGRKYLLEELSEHYATIDEGRKRIIIHSSSFGELEQAKPVIAMLRERLPDVHIHVTFFSPSGYDNAVSRYSVPDLITYLPFDRQKDVSTFLEIVNPDLFIFVRYDLWYNLVKELQTRQIPSVVISATYTDTIGKRLPIIRSLYKRMYRSIHRIYTTSPKQSRRFEELLESADTVITAGDTRIDQTLERRRRSDIDPILPKSISELELLDERMIVVAGSTWQNDEVLLHRLYRAMSDEIVLFIAPHTIDEQHLRHIESLFGDAVIRMSRISEYRGETIFLWDRIGTLFELYLYADAAYVGGGFGAGVHNVIEPASYLRPVICGPNHHRSAEVAELASLGAVTVVSNADELIAAMKHYAAAEPELIERVIDTLDTYFQERKGAAQRIVDDLCGYLT